MTFVTPDAKKTCDSPRMEKREVVTEIRAVRQPMAAGWMSGGPRGVDPGREDTPPTPWMELLRDLHTLNLHFLSPAPASQGGKKVEEARGTADTEFGPRNGT